jgi:Mn2+/Fe2+ NRAMP family transporter
MSTEPTSTDRLSLTLWQRLKQVGPALVLATVVLGPGTLTLSTIAGSVYGYQLLWVPVVTTVFMITYTWMSARIGLVTGQTLFQVTRRKYGRALAKVGGAFGFLAILAFQAGNTAAIGFAAEALFGGPVRVWAVVFVALALGLLLLPNLYDKVELLVKVVVGLMIVTFVGTVLMVGIDAEQATAGLVPGFPDTEAVFLALGIAATTFSIVAAVYQSYLMQEKKWGPEQLSIQGFESFLGIGILGMIAIIVLLTSAGALYGTGSPTFSAQEMASQLEPLVGPAAFYLFTIGFFFATLSSLVVNPLIGGTLMADGFGQEASMDGRPVKAWTVLALACGLAPVLIFKGSPVELLRIAQGCAVVAFPVLGYLVLSLAGDRDVMGPHANRTWVHGVAIVGYLTILGIVVNYVRQIIETNWF